MQVMSTLCPFGYEDTNPTNCAVIHWQLLCSRILNCSIFSCCSDQLATLCDGEHAFKVGLVKMDTPPGHLTVRGTLVLL